MMKSDSDLRFMMSVLLLFVRNNIIYSIILRLSGTLTHLRTMNPVPVAVAGSHVREYTRVASRVQIVNPVKVKENVVRQLKTQIEDLERFVHFLQISGSAAGALSKLLLLH